MSLRYKDVLIRPVEAGDLPFLQRLHNDPDINEATTGWDFPVSMDRQLAWFSSLKNDRACFRGMIELQNGEIVGTVSVSDFDYRNRTLSFNGAKILREYQNAGYGRQAFITMMSLAFDDLDFFCMEVRHLDSQEVTRHVLEKLGLTLEGTLRGRIHKNGQRHDVLVWSMTADEYRRSLPIWECFDAKPDRE